jgi:hypothetical protein
MRNISEIDISRYSSYFLTEEIGDVILKFNTSNGLVDIDVKDYDTFSTENGTLIGFKEPHMGTHNYVYFSGSDRKYFQNLSYESFQDIFNQPKGKLLVQYTFFNSVELLPRGERTISDSFLSDDFVRCDYNKFGGMPFYRLENKVLVERVMNIMDISGVGHILCVFLKHSENPNRGCQGDNTKAETLTGGLKTIYEWAEAYKSPFNNQEPIAKAAQEFLNEIGMPENVLNDIINSQGDMRVSRYLKGETRQSYSFDENIETPESLQNFMNSRCKYRSLYQLMNSHPRKNKLSNSIFLNYKSHIENLLYQIYIENDLNVFTPEFLKKYFQTNINKDSSTVLKLLSLLEEME